MAEPADKKRGTSPEKPKPAGYFEGETMTRRTVFALGGQAAGAVALTVVALLFGAPFWWDVLRRLTGLKPGGSEGERSD